MKLLSRLFLFIKRVLSPISTDDDSRRREFILNILLISCIVLLFLGIILDLLNRFFSDPVTYQENSLSTFTTIGVLCFFLFLYFLSRKKLINLASYFLIALFFLLTAYMGIRWGIDVPAQIIFYPLVIVMAGILINTWFAFFTTGLIATTMVVTGYFQKSGIMALDQYWKSEMWTVSDIVMIILIYFVIATVSWLSNREIDRSLKRARTSEAELKEERDLLEIRVRERTEELRKTEMEKMSQAYRFVEFGRLAGGIFHDLMNPLTALSLNIENDDIQRAKKATEHIHSLMESMRKHLMSESAETLFSLNVSVEELVRLLSSYAKNKNVKIVTEYSDKIEILGDPIAFTQVITNIMSNAVDSYPPFINRGFSSLYPREIYVKIKKGDKISITIQDSGQGMGEEILNRIFEPFFTTKNPSHGLGIGLSIAKRIVERKFGGSISVDSALGRGTIFTIYLDARGS